ncbi:hypothetical protein [Dickeya solani]|uniref:hypothetical protein n=1 Tax=Dickeya solani TaxID=1089444 RepID=UPI00168B27FE|nr:hypothetical protein [Dickeya solani]
MAMLPSVRPGKQTVWLAATGKKKPLNEGFFYESIRQWKEKRRHAANRQLRFGTHKNSSVRHVPSRQIVRNYTRRRGEFKQKNAVFCGGQSVAVSCFIGSENAPFGSLFYYRWLAGQCRQEYKESKRCFNLFI